MAVPTWQKKALELNAPKPLPCGFCDGAGEVLVEIKVVEVVDLVQGDGSVVRVNETHYEYEPIICPICGGSGFEPEVRPDLRHPAVRVASKVGKWLMRAVRGMHLTS